jgi:signal peptidase I
MGNSGVRSACRLAVGVALVAIALHTWLAMGLVIPVTVDGSSMAPTLEGPHWVYRCGACKEAFSIGFDQAAPNMAAECPSCGRLVESAVGSDAVGDRLIVDRTAYILRPPRRWEVVVFRSPVDGQSLSVKRVAGLPGETVSIVDGELRISGASVAGATVKYTLRYGDHEELRDGVQLGADEFFVLGDNEAISIDSRNWPTGPGLKAKLLLGKPLFVR